jgi:hypothetical protein
MSHATKQTLIKTFARVSAAKLNLINQMIVVDGSGRYFCSARVKNVSESYLLLRHRILFVLRCNAGTLSLALVYFGSAWAATSMPTNLQLPPEQTTKQLLSLEAAPAINLLFVHRKVTQT